MHVALTATHTFPLWLCIAVLPPWCCRLEIFMFLYYNWKESGQSHKLEHDHTSTHSQAVNRQNINDSNWLNILNIQQIHWCGEQNDELVMIDGQSLYQWFLRRVWGNFSAVQKWQLHWRCLTFCVWLYSWVTLDRLKGWDNHFSGSRTFSLLSQLAASSVLIPLWWCRDVIRTLFGCP